MSAQFDLCRVHFVDAVDCAALDALHGLWKFNILLFFVSERQSFAAAFDSCGRNFAGCRDFFACDAAVELDSARNVRAILRRDTKFRGLALICYFCHLHSLLPDGNSCSRQPSFKKVSVYRAL